MNEGYSMNEGCVRDSQKRQQTREQRTKKMREVETWRVEEDRREKGNWLVKELVKVTVAGHLAVNSRVTVGAQSGHSRVTVGSQSGHMF